MAEIHISPLDDPGPVVIELTGSLAAANAALLDDLLTLLPERGHHEAVIDLSGARFIDSAIVATLAQAINRGTTLTIRDASGTVRRTLDASGLSRLVSIDAGPP